MSRYPPVQNESSEEEDPFHNMYPALLVELNERDQYEPELMKLRAYLVKPHAESETEANDAKLRKKAVNYRLDEQLNLYRLFRNERMVLISKIDDRQDILMQVHNGHGHYGQEATWSRLYKQYWWPTAYEEVKEYVRSCHECQMLSNVPNKVALHGNVPVNHLFERFAIDYIGPFPMMKKKNKYILLAVECYSRWPVAKAVKYANSTTTVDFMYNELFTVFGASKFLLSDNGLHFTGNEVEEFAKHLKIKHQYTSPYHPQTNGMVESINGVIVKSLKKTAREHNEYWDTLLPTVLYAYRTKAHSILKLSPYEMLFGVEPLGVDKDVLQEYGRKIGFERLSYLQQRNGLQNFMVDYQPQVEAHDQESKINVGDQVLLLKHHRKNVVFTHVIN
ncbi:hypothetical protein G6F58_012053 [Rhizopus delemar]|nr:hypothetical protein G6F58_012053 [Rhizopus delemar]